jgi:hypothetical protein
MCVCQDRGSSRTVRLSVGRIICSVLAFMVLAWGTGYKLSLYHAEQTSAPAKVCTRGSDAARCAVECAAAGRNADQRVAAVVYVKIDPGFPNKVAHEALEDGGSEISPLRLSPVLHLRPPPAGLRLTV